MTRKRHNWCAAYCDGCNRAVDKSSLQIVRFRKLCSICFRKVKK